MTNSSKSQRHDLEDRTTLFGVKVITFCKKLSKNVITKPLISQLIRAATSVGANYCEADDAESKKDFRHKIGISKKEARESKHFLRMIVAACPAFKEQTKELSQEAKELNPILNKIFQKVS